MHQEDVEFSSEGLQEIDQAMRAATRITCSTTDFATALARFVEAFPTLAPNMHALLEMDDAEVQRMRCFLLFREIWIRVPRPDHAFRPLPLPKQERNEPCQCGSGRKFKQCCARLEGSLPFDPQGLSLLRYVLEELPTSAYANLPFEHLSPDELAFVAEQWVQTGRADIATFLLVPLLSDVKKLDARHEAAFDTLGDAYLQLGMPERRIELAERVMKARDLTLRCAAMHRGCTILSDAGDWPAAWKLFAEASRAQPDNPALSHLEVIMLASEGQTERAKERARYWLTRLARQGNAEGEESLMDFLRMMSEDPDAGLAMIRGEGEGDDDDGFMGGEDEEDAECLYPLVGMLETLPAPQSHYLLQPVRGDAGGLKADRELEALELQWAALFNRELIERAVDEMEELDSWQQSEWIVWLTKNPLAWQSFSILDDVGAFLDATLFPESLDASFDAMEYRLFAHAAFLLDRVIADNQAQGCRLEWGWQENRPALRLLARFIDVLDDVGEELRLLEWLVSTLNPSDNQGRRESLARLLIESGRAADALALCERYPGDSLGSMLYARVLALHQLARLDDAAIALALARQDRPKILSTLIAVRPRAPELDFNSTLIGDDDEAWYYRMDWLPVWTHLGALDWLKKAGKKKR